MELLVIAVGLGLLSETPYALADAKVTLCHAADEIGAGMNLQAALLQPPGQNSPANTITFQCAGPASIQVTSTLSISQSTVIDGGGTVTLASNIGQPMIDVGNTNVSLFLYNLTLTNTTTGRPVSPCGALPAQNCGGSVLHAAGTVELHNTRIVNSTYPLYATSGSLNVYSSQFIGNHGVVISTIGTTATITGSTFQDNSDARPIVSFGGQVTINANSQFSNNMASAFENCQLIVDRSLFQNNQNDGAISSECLSTITNCTFDNNASISNGGAIVFPGFVFAGNAQQITIQASKFLNNSAKGEGGAIFFDMPMSFDRNVSINYTLFQGNSSTSGGAIAADAIDFVPNNSNTNTMNLQVVTFSRNKASSNGGAIWARATTLKVSRAVFADSDAGENGGAVGLTNESPLHSFFANSLLVRNHAASGSAFFGDDVDFINSTIDSNIGLALSVNAPARPPQHVTLSNSIVSNNSQGGCGPAGLIDDKSINHNLQFPGNDCGTSVPVANPRLDTMYIPIPTSPPMGNGDLSVCMAQPVNGRDVYGMGRPSGTACAIGAAEAEIQVLLNRRKGTDTEGLLKRLQQLLSQ